MSSRPYPICPHHHPHWEKLLIIRSRAPCASAFQEAAQTSPRTAKKRVVLSTTIDKYSYASNPQAGAGDQVKSLDFDVVHKYVSIVSLYDGELDLVKGVLNTLLKAGRRVCTVYPQRCSSCSTGIIFYHGSHPHRHHPPMAAKPLTNYDIAQLTYHVGERS